MEVFPLGNVENKLWFKSTFDSWEINQTIFYGRGHFNSYVTNYQRVPPKIGAVWWLKIPPWFASGIAEGKLTIDPEMTMISAKQMVVEWGYTRILDETWLNCELLPGFRNR